MGWLSQHCGPGISGRKRGRHSTDQACLSHDEGYERRSKRYGLSVPYTHHNRADERLLNTLEKNEAKGFRENLIKGVAVGYFKTKKAIAPRLEEKYEEYKTPMISRTKRRLTDFTPQNLSRKRVLIGPDLPSNVVSVSPADSGENLASESAIKKMAGKRRTRMMRRPRKRSRRKLSLAKRVRRIVKAHTWTKPWTERNVKAGTVVNTLNLTEWINFDTEMSLRSNIDAIMTDDGGPTFWVPDAAGTNTITFQPNLSSLGPAGLLAQTNAKYKISKSMQLMMRNNTSFPADLTIYIVKVEDFTTLSPTTELNDLYLASIKDSLASDFKRDPFQYFSITGVGKNQRKYSIYQKQALKFKAGEQIDFSIKLPNYIYDVATIDAQTTASTYLKGTYQVLFRLQGVPSHDSTNSLNTGTSQTQLDYVMRTFRSVSMKLGNAVHQTNMDARTGYTQAVPVVGESEAPQVAPMDLN